MPGMELAGPVPLNLAATWRLTRDLVKRHFGVFATLSAAFVFLPSALLTLLMPAKLAARLPDPAHPVALPPGVGLASIIVLLLGLIAWFVIAAIAADPAEGGGRSVAATLRSVLPAIGRALIAGLVLFAGAFCAVFVLLLIGGIVVAIAGVGTGTAAIAAANGLAGPVGNLALIAAIWATARLLPLPGVLLREQLGPIAAIWRALALSRGSTARIVAIPIAVAVVVSLAQLVLTGAARLLGLPGAAFGVVLARDAAIALVSVYYYAASGIVYRQLAVPA